MWYEYSWHKLIKSGLVYKLPITFYTKLYYAYIYIPYHWLIVFAELRMGDTET